MCFYDQYFTTCVKRPMFKELLDSFILTLKQFIFKYDHCFFRPVCYSLFKDFSICMKNRIIYTIILSTIGLMFFFEILNYSPTGDIINVMYYVLVLYLFCLIIFVLQIILAVNYLSKSSNRKDFLFIFSSVFSIVLLMIYIDSARTLYQGQDFSEIIDKKLVNDFGIKRSIKAIHPIFNLNMFYAFPSLSQIIIFILRYKHKATELPSHNKD